MSWFKKHVDTVIVLGGILSAVIWMQGKFASTEDKINAMRVDLVCLKSDFSTLKTDVAQLKDDVSILKNDVILLKSDVSTIKTVLILKKIMPNEFAIDE